MPSIGRFSYPALTLTESIPFVERIARGFGGSVSRGGFARALGMSERGGRYSALVGALRAWGLAEGRSELRVTQLGFQLASPVSREEAVHGRAVAGASAPLLVELSRRFGVRLPDQARLSLVLEELTGADRVQIASHAPAVQRAFRDVAHDLAAAHAERAQERGPGPKDRSGESSSEDLEPVRGNAGPESREGQAAETGEVHLAFPGGKVSLPETPANLDALIGILQARRSQITEGT